MYVSDYIYLYTYVIDGDGHEFCVNSYYNNAGIVLRIYEVENIRIVCLFNYQYFIWHKIISNYKIG